MKSSLMLHELANLFRRRRPGAIHPPASFALDVVEGVLDGTGKCPDLLSTVLENVTARLLELFAAYAFSTAAQGRQ